MYNKIIHCLALIDKSNPLHCFFSPVAVPEIPNLTLTLTVNKSFLVIDPIFNAYGEQVNDLYAI